MRAITADRPAKVVTKIAANPALSRRSDPNRILKVAAYCRVSTDSEDQLNSYKAQKEYYSEYIKKNPKWRFAGIYADEGITGTLVKKRDDFLRMIEDCEKGKIDLILIKSIARYARNIVDCLSYIRKLKAMNIGIYFEEQNINSLTEDSEVYIGIHGVLAQAESENISANVSWGINKRMQNGTYACRIEMLGYRRDKETKEIYIVPEEAEIVKKIFYMYLQGASLDQIKAYLEGNGIKTIRGNSKWDKHGIKAMLTNEKYVGDIIFQKTYRTDCLSKKVRINRGEKDRYLVSNNHPAIIDRETFWLVKKEMNKRSSKRRSSENAITELGKYSGKYALSELLFCDVCGSPFRRKTWTRNGVKRVYWRCLGHIEKGSDGCNQAKGLEEKVLHEAICRALTKSIPDKDDVKNLARTMLSYSVSEDQLMLECRTLENSIKDLLAKANDAEKMCIRTQGNKEPYYEEIKKYYLSVAELRERLSKLKEQLETSDTYQAEMKQISDWLEEEDVSFDEYDDTIVRYMISSIRVTEELNLVISFKGGGTVTEPLNLKL